MYARHYGKNKSCLKSSVCNDTRNLDLCHDNLPVVQVRKCPNIPVINVERIKKSDPDEIILYQSSLGVKSDSKKFCSNTSVPNKSCRSIIVYRLPVTLLQVLLFCSFIGLVFGNCQYVAVNLAKYDQCIDNVCQYTTSVDTNVQLINGNEVCLDFEGINGIQRLNITVDYAIQLKTIEYSYYSGDPLFDAKGACACNNGFSTGATCQNTCGDFTLQYSNMTYCKTAIHQSKKCALTPLNVESTWCRKYGLSVNNRLKIIKYSDSSQIMIQLSLKWGNNTEEIMLTGANKEINLKKLPFVLTGYDLSINDLPAPTFAVIDKQHVNDFYMIPATQINSINTYDMNKIGWIKYKTTPITQASNLAQVSSQLIDCDRNSFRDMKPWFTTDQLLSNFKMYLSDTYNAHTILLDPEFPYGHYTRTDHPVVANYLLDVGFIFTDLNGAMKSWGITIDNVPSIYPDNDYYLTLLTNHGNKTGMFACDESPLLDEFGSEIMVGFCINNDRDFGFYSYYWVCNQTTCFEQNGSYFGTKFQAHLWPDRLTVLQWNGTIIDENQNLGQELLIPYKLATTNLKLDFHGLNVTFVKTSITPELRTVTAIGYHLIIDALSLSNEGNCYVSTSPAALLIPVSIYLRTQVNTYNISLSQSAFNGSTIVYLTCGPNIVFKNLSIAYNNTPAYLEWKSEVDLNNTWSKKNIALFGLFTNYKLMTLKAKIITVLTWIIIIIATILIILIIIGTHAYMLPYYIIIIPIVKLTKIVKKTLPKKNLALTVVTAPSDYKYPTTVLNQIQTSIVDELGENVLSSYLVLLSLLNAGKLKSPGKPISTGKEVQFKETALIVPSCYHDNKLTPLLQGNIIKYNCPCEKLVQNKITLRDAIFQGQIHHILDKLLPEVNKLLKKLVLDKKETAKVLVIPVTCPLKGDLNIPLLMIVLAAIKANYINWGFIELDYGTDITSL